MVYDTRAGDIQVHDALVEPTVIVNGEAPLLNRMLLTSTPVVLMDRSVTFDLPKVRDVRQPVGTAFGVQLAAVFQSPLVGLKFQVALPARTIWPVMSRSKATNTLIEMKFGFHDLPGLSEGTTVRVRSFPSPPS